MLPPDLVDELLPPMAADPWFGQLDLREQREVLSSARLLVLHSGEYVFRQGDAADGFYGLVNGALKASTLREDGREAILAVIEPGNWFGETSAADGTPRMHDLTVLTASRVLHVAQPRFEALAQRGAVARALLRLQSMHMRGVYAMVEDATLRSTRARVARRLQRLARGDASPQSAERHHIAVTQETLAMMLGITRQTLALELKALASRGAISMGYGHIRIESLDKLRALESEA